MKKPTLQTILISILVIVALFVSIYFPYKWKQLSNDFLDQTNQYGELLEQINDLQKEVRELKNGDKEVSDKYKIYLTSRQFIPESEISDTLKSSLINTSHKQIHILLQFYHLPNNDERAELSNLNVTLCSYVHNNTYFASIPTKYLTEIHNLSFIRWVGDIFPEDKISPRIQDGKIGEWAINPDGSVNIVVKLFDDVSADDAKSILGRYSSTVEEPGMLNDWTVTVTSETTWELANEDGVQWIEEVPPPETTFNDETKEVEK